jgi:hypothetical protein
MAGMKTTGYWTHYAGEERQVYGRVHGPTLWLCDRSDPTRRAEEVEANQLGDVIRVRVTANWRGGKILVSQMKGADEVVFHTDDKILATREGLYGDHYTRWGGVALVRELSSIEETVTWVRQAEGRTW